MCAGRFLHLWPVLLSIKCFVPSDISIFGVSGSLRFCVGVFRTAKDPRCNNIVVMAGFSCTGVGGTTGNHLLIVVFGVSGINSLSQELRLTGIGICSRFTSIVLLAPLM